MPIPLATHSQGSLDLTLAADRCRDLQSTAVNGAALEAAFVAQACDATLPNPACNRNRGFHLPIVKRVTR